MDENIGKKYSNYTVIEFDYIDKSRQKKYKCLCSCGKIKSVRITALRTGESKSCGCLRDKATKERFWKGYKEISGHYWSAIKIRALKRNIDFNITIEDGWNLFIQQNRKCKYTNLELHFPKTEKDKCHGNVTASLDRIDSSKGYTIDNIQWVHKHINIMKMDFSEEYFIKMCKLVSNKD